MDSARLDKRARTGRNGHQGDWPAQTFPDGAPIRYDWSAQLEKKATGKVDFVDGTGKCSIDLGTASPILKDFKFTSPRVAVLDNNL